MIITYDFDGEYVTWTTDGYAGTVFFRNDKFLATNVYGILKNKDNSNLNVEYLSYIAKINFPKFVNKSNSNFKLMNNVVVNIQAPFPFEIK
ncbi:restriction endonuclease subunit S [Ureaplasma canigenitalium]|uniref:restriction endonuclease subunit S n=1 Tax=Ureaplasma canigenitalium TaxID=42092 RepID=UPI000AB60420|nr:restriction endonuclease subunit S [Ureaplasma canigenitalium]